MRARRTDIITVITAVALTVVAGAADAAHGDHVVIAEVQVGGSSARDEFVELYNPTSAAISIEGWRLSRRTASGNESNLVTAFPALVVPIHGSVLIAHPDGTFAAGADQRYTTQDALAQDNTIVLYGPAPSGGGARPIVDLVGWGTASSREGSAAPNPPASQSIERKPGGAAGNAQDTRDNASDFIVQPQPSPQAASSAARPVIDTSGSGSGGNTGGTTGGGGVSADSGGGSSGNGASGTSNPNAGPGTSNVASGSSTTTGASGDTTASGAARAGGTSATTGTGTTAGTDTTGTTSGGTAAATGGSATSAPLVEPSVPSSPSTATHVRINEFVVDPADGDEWIELVNVGPNALSLVDWTIEDGAETRTLITGAIGVGDHRFLVVRKPKGVLNNTGDRIVLRDPRGSVIDAVTYGDWDDGKRDDNAPTASDPTAVARVVDGQDTNTDRTDFVRTEVPTPGASNAIVAASDGDTRASADAPRPVASSIVVNELFPDPAEDGPREEFIELANVGNAGVDLTGWRLRDELGMEYVIRNGNGPTVASPGATLAFPRSRTGIALNNSGGEIVRLFRPDGDRAASVAEYRGTAPHGASWSRDGSWRWLWTTRPTPSAANILQAPNRPPDAVIDGPPDGAIGTAVTFDASDSVDPDRDVTTLSWDFGDPRTDADHVSGAVGRYVYDRAGVYVVRLTVTDAHGATATASHRIVIRATATGATDTTRGSEDTGSFVPPPAASPTTLRFSEIAPNPIGRDDSEWLELENTGDAPVPLRGWAIAITIAGRDDARDRERRSVLSMDAVVASHTHMVVPRTALRIALRNDGATLVLRAPDSAAIDRVTYEDATEGESFARAADASWEWTATPTPGAPNVITARVEDADEGEEMNTPRRAPAVRSRRSSKGAVVAASLVDLREVGFGATVVARGVVTAPPRTVGKQFFYLGDDHGGVQVFFGQREPPAVTLGDRVEVTGELREVGGEPRIGIAQTSNIRVVGSARAPDPATLRIRDAGADRLGTLVVIEGEIVDRRGRTIAVDDGSEELRAALPSSDTADAVRVGDTVRVVGVLSRTRNGFRLLPRSAGDVTLVARAAPAAGAASIPPPAVPPELELALLGGGSGALVVASLWRRRRLLGLAFSGARAAIAALFRRFG